MDHNGTTTKLRFGILPVEGELLQLFLKCLTTMKISQVPRKGQGFMYVASKFNQEKHYKSSLNDKRGIQREMSGKFINCSVKMDLGKWKEIRERRQEKETYPHYLARMGIFSSVTLF